MNQPSQLQQPAHSPCGPSSLERRALCPGSLQAEAPLPPASNDNADRGTDLHACLAKCVLQPPEGREALLAGLMDDYDAWGVQQALDVFDDFQTQFDSPEVLVEQRLDLSRLSPEVAFGTVDLALVEPFSHGVILDFKSGMNAVPEAHENIQLAAYAVGLAHAYDLEQVTVCIVQPFIKHFSRHVYIMSEIDMVAERIRAVVAACQQPNAPQVPGEAQCRYCRAAGCCPALQKKVDTVALAKVEPAQLQGLELAQWLEAADLAELRIGAVRARAHAILAAGGEIPGWHLAEGKKSRAWADEAAVEKALQEVAAKLQKDPAAILKTEVVSPSQIEKSWGTAKAVREALAPLIIRGPGKPHLERGSSLEQEPPQLSA